MTSPSADQITRGIGGFLCLAAVLKVGDAFVSYEFGPGSMIPLVGAAIELFLGVALVFRVDSRISVPAAGILFALLAGMSLLGTIRGVASCGCLGALILPPWVLLIVDLAAAGVLLWRVRSSGSFNHRQVRFLYAACVAVFSFGLATSLILHPQSSTTADATSAYAIAWARTVIINPEQLQNRPWSLGRQIAIDADLSHGDWKVIIARAGCHRCESYIKSGACNPEGRERVAVVVAGGNEDWAVPTECQAVVGHLSKDKTWMFNPPITLWLTEGRVIKTL